MFGSDLLGSLLEFDRVVDAVRRFAQTPPGEARLEELQPAAEREEVASALAATAETAR
jgi:dsDNA-specific endonuclease/ATPase MutS2